jgi:hypothetical protein
LSGAPYKGHILLGKVVKWPAYFGKVLDKASVEIGEPNETSDFFEFHEWGPISDGLYLGWVHRNFARLMTTHYVGGAGRRLGKKVPKEVADNSRLGGANGAQRDYSSRL